MTVITGHRGLVNWEVTTRFLWLGCNGVVQNVFVQHQKENSEKAEKYKNGEGGKRKHFRKSKHKAKGFSTQYIIM